MDSQEERIRYRIRELRSLELYFYSDNRSLEFIGQNPDNTEELVVNEKISAINNGLISLSDVPALARRIVSMPVDKALGNHDLDLVTELADMKATSRHDQLIHFCSLYCNYHLPDVYPVFSPVSVELLTLLEEKTQDQKLKGIDFSSYKPFCEGIDLVISKYGLDGMNYHETDKFFWINASRIREFIKGL